MNKSDLIDAVTKTTSLAKREADEAVNALIHTVSREVKAGRRVVVAGFGSFNPTHRGARMGRNPQTGAPVAISASRGVRFTASAMLKDILNGRSPLPELRISPSASRAAKATGPAKSSSKKSTKVAKRSTKKAAKRAPARKTAKRVAKGSKKVVRRVPAKKAAKRAPARKAAKQSARKAVRRA